MFWLFPVFFIAAIFTPNIGLFRIEYLVASAGILFSIIMGKWGIYTHFRKELGIIFLMILSASMSLLTQSVLGYEFIWRDAMIFVRLVFAAAAILTVALACSRLTDFQRSHQLLVMTAILVVIITLAQYYNVYGINDKLFSIYAERYRWLIVGTSWRRALGTFGNPNYWGALIVTLLMYITHLIFWRNKIAYLPIAGSLFVSIIFTGSRGSLVSYIAGLIIGTFIIMIKANDKPRFGPIILTVLILLSTTSVMGNLDKYYENKDRFSISNTHTLNSRVEIWKTALSKSSDNIFSFLFGQGPRKAAKDKLLIGDNAYVRTWRDYGLIGLFLYLLLLYTLVQRTVSLMNSEHQNIHVWSQSLLLMLIAWSIFELSADTWYFGRSVAVFLSYYVLVHSVAINQINQEKEQAPSSSSLYPATSGRPFPQK